MFVAATNEGTESHLPWPNDEGKGIAKFIAQDSCFGDEDLLQVQQLANKLLAMQAACVMNRNQEVIKKFPVMGIQVDVKHSRSTSCAMLAEKYVATLLCPYSIYCIC